MVRKLSKLEKEIYAIGATHFPEHPHPQLFVLKEWDFYGNSENPHGKLIFYCEKCDMHYSMGLTQEEQEKLFNLDGPTAIKDRDRPYTI